ncbi:MAG: porin [Planctomycetota bacterium]
MKKLVFSAAALTAASAAFANESDWAQLDQDIQALSASLQGLEGTGMTIGGRIRAGYENSGDITGSFNTAPGPDAILGTPDDVITPGNDLGGFALYNARLFAAGTTGQDIGYRIEIDFAQAGLLDAYLDIPVGNEITVRTGRFRGHVLRESLIDSGDLLFFDRSATAALFSARRTGIAAVGNFEAFEWAVTVQNGGDGVGDDLFYAVRAGIDILGEGTDLVEGAYGASEEMEASAGVAYFNDDATEDADGFAVEGSLATNQFSANATIVSLGDAAIGSQLENNERMIVPMPIAGDSTIFSVGGSFMLTEASSEYGAWELAARYQDFDDPGDSTLIDVGANYYAHGHDMKYIINVTSGSSDGGGLDGTLVRVGVQSRF